MLYLLYSKMSNTECTCKDILQNYSLVQLLRVIRSLCFQASRINFLIEKRNLFNVNNCTLNKLFLRKLASLYIELDLYII